MINRITGMSPRKAALMAGLAFITTIFIVTAIDDFILPNFVVPGDTAALASDIESNTMLFGIAVVGYLTVLALDSVIGLAFYAILKPANKKLASVVVAFRLMYAGILIVSLIALSFQFIDAYGYGFIKLVGYVFFAVHLFALGYSVFKTGYIPKILGILLMIASFCYIVFFVDFLPETLLIISMLVMAIAELSLSIWLIIKRNKMPGK